MLHTERESENSLPMICAEICAYARMLLWEFITQAGRENVFYADTDSIVVNEIGYSNLLDRLDNTRLGALKLEGVSYSNEFWAPKDYALDNDVHIKGVRKKAIQVGDRIFIQSTFKSWDWNLSQGHDGFIRVDTTIKHLSRENKKAQVFGLGPTKPIELEEW